MKKINSIFIIALVMLLCMNIHIKTYAKEIIESEETGSISIQLSDGEQKVSDGSLTIYQVAEVTERDGAYSFEYTTEWEKCLSDLEDFQSGKLAKEFEEYAQRHVIHGETLMIANNEKVVFEGLKAGLYLISQKDASKGYEKINPFLVVLPVKVGEEWIYNIDASPKIDLTEEVPSSDETTGTTESTLPQTGQMNWPIPVLAITGMTLFAIGWGLCFGNKG